MSGSLPPDLEDQLRVLQELLDRRHDRLLRAMRRDLWPLLLQGQGQVSEAAGRGPRREGHHDCLMTSSVESVSAVTSLIDQFVVVL